MQKQYSIAEAKNHLPGIVHEVERDGAVELTRRGRPVAVMLSVREYERLKPHNSGPDKTIEQFRRDHDVASLDITPDVFPPPRDPVPGREFAW